MSSAVAIVVVMTAIRDVTGEPNGDTNCPNFARLMEANVSGMKQTRSRIVLRINPYPWGLLPPEAQEKVRAMVADVWMDPFTPPEKAMLIDVGPLDRAIADAVEREFREAVPIGAISYEYPAVLRHDNSGDGISCG